MRTIVFSHLANEVKELGDAYRAARQHDMKLPLKQMARKAKASVRRNFDVGGRPTAWKKLQNRSGKPLIQSERLKGSIKHRIIGKYNFQIYSNDEKGKAAAHDRGRFDYEITPKRAPRLKWQVHGVWRSADKIENHNIPARPFMHLQVADVDWMVKRMDETIARHFRKHKVAE